MIQSGGVLRKGVIWQGTPASFPGWDAIPLTGNRWSSYSTLYQHQLWVNTVVSKRGRATARLPLKVYERDSLNRPEAQEHPYATLLRRPNPRLSPFAFWLWVSSTFDVFGEMFLGKIRDSGGRPVTLAPLHPTAMQITGERDGRLLWKFENGKVRIEDIDSADLIHLKTYNPSDENRGLSSLEPLRRTLEFEDAAQRAQSSFWRKGARFGAALTHPGRLSQAAADRLKIQWDSIAAGADNTGSTVVLEEGMKPEVVTISANEAQYIESRKLNREEVCAVYDVPPPVVHILDRATFSNITEQMRSMYRDTMAPHLKAIESELETQLRGAVRPGADGPDFGGEVYAEFLLDEVLRGDFETRADAYQKAINSGWMTPAEVRRAENQPFIEGSDRLFINSAVTPMSPEEEAKEIPRLLQQIYLAVGTVISAEEAREILNRQGAGLVGPGPEQPATEGRANDPVLRRHLLGITSRLNELASEATT